MSSALEADSKARDVIFLDAYSQERWECVLHYMVGSQQHEGISADAVRILLHAGLMKRYVYILIVNISINFIVFNFKITTKYYYMSCYLYVLSK